MKQINVWFDDDEHEKLVKEKDGMTWHDFLMTLIKDKPRKEEKKK